MTSDRAVVVEQPVEKRMMLYIPDTLSRWPWMCTMNPYYKEVNAESRAWVMQFMTFPGSTFDAETCLDERAGALLCGLANPTAPKDVMRLGCDIAYLGLVIDDYADTLSGTDARKFIKMVMDIMRNPDKPRPEDEIQFGKALQDLFQRIARIGTRSSAKRFLDSCEDCFKAFMVQAQRRANGSPVQTVEEYFRYRAGNVGSRPVSYVFECHMDVPDDVFYHPILKEMRTLAGQLFFLDNDILSYNKEQAVNDADWNIVTVVMHQYNLDVAGAMQWAAKCHDEIKSKFIALVTKVPSFGPEIDNEVSQYIFNLACSIRANVCWSFAGTRYFGDKGQEVQRTRWVEMTPSDKTIARQTPLSRQRTPYLMTKMSNFFLFLQFASLDRLGFGWFWLVLGGLALGVAACGY